MLEVCMIYKAGFFYFHMGW